jgi:hypothetical protein
MSGLTTNDTAARMFYQKITDSDTSFSEDRELVPAPNINLTIETFYANESIIGYTYNVTLTGYAASKQDRNQFHDDTISYVVGSIAKIQNIFDVVGNGGKLVVKTPNANTAMMVFKGGRIKSINFAPSNNQWVRYSEYTIELEFNDAKLFGCNHSSEKGCDSTLFDGGGGVVGISSDLAAVQSKLVDHGIGAPIGFKIKSFNDKWTMDLQDEIYDWAKIDDSLELNSKRYNVQYTISAVGQHYWDDQGKLFPAWKQAKAFCQDRLVKQINGLYQNIAMHYSGPELNFCGSSEDLTQIHVISSPSIHTTIGAYNIFDEKITFGPSESDGSFEITYSSILKRNSSNCVTHPEATHTLNITRGGTKEFGKTQARSVTLSGTIQGLLRYTNEGSIIWPNAEGFTIPDSPGAMVFLPPKNDVKYKWNKAKELLDRFLDECSGRIICSELADIVFKCLTTSCSFVYPGQDCADTSSEQIFTADLIPNNFNITHNYGLGTIDYSVEFSPESKSRCNITISTEEPVPITAEFTIPGKGIYYQPLGGCTPKKWTINAEGITGCPQSCDTGSGGLGICSDITIGCENYMPDDSAGTYLLLSKQKTYNPIDGSFSYNATYVCTNCSGYGSC